MGKRIFWIFILLISVTTAVAVHYLQSPQFAEILKKEIKSRVPKNAGIALEFERLTVGIFPPSISLSSVDLAVVSDKNLLGLAKPTQLQISQLGISFKMFQAFSRGITINKVFLSGAKIDITLPHEEESANKKNSNIADLLLKPLLIDIDKNLQLHVLQLEVRDTEIKVVARTSAGLSTYSVQKINYISVAPDFGRATAVFDVKDVVVKTPSLKDSLEDLKFNIELSKQKIKIYSLDVRRSGEAAHLEGELIGSFVDIKKMEANVRAIVRANLDGLSAQLKELDGFGGAAVADAQISGQLENPIISSDLEVTNFSYGLWGIEKIRLRGKWQQNQLSLLKLSAENGGGKITLNNEIDLALPLKNLNTKFVFDFNNVSLAEFSGDLKQDINNLKAVLNGKIAVDLKLSVSEKKTNLDQLRITPELKIEHFELNNQVYGAKRPYQRIFPLKPFEAVGVLNFENESLKIEKFSMSFASGVMNVSGSVNKANGYNIHGKSESINLGQEIGDIADLPLISRGGIDIYVHGKGDDVLFDFDLQQKDAKFVNFDFGELSGRVTLDDKNNRIHLKNLRGKKNDTNYTADGFVDIGSNDDDLDINVQFNDASPDDIFTVFAHQVKDISWLPRGMTGSVSVNANVGGGYSKGIASLQINADVVGKRLFYRGEGLTDFKAKGGVDRGVIFAKNVSGKKYNSLFSGEISYYPNDEIIYRIEVPSGKIRDWDYFTSLELPMDGEWRIHSSGKGSWEQLKSETEIQVFQGFVRTRPVPAFTIKINTDNGRSQTELISQDKSIHASYGASGKNSDRRAELGVSMRGSDFGYILCSMNRRSCSDPSLKLLMSGDLNLKWSNSWTNAEGAGQVSSISLSRNDFSLGLKKPAKFSFKKGLLDFPTAELVGDSSSILVSGKHALDGSERNWTFKGNSSLKVLEFVTPLIEEARGNVALNASIGGDSKDIILGGSLRIDDGFMRLGGLDAPLEGLKGQLAFSGPDLNIRELIGKIGGGDVQATGGMRFFLMKPPRMGFDLFLSNNRLRFFPVNYAEFHEARLSFAGDAPPYLFGGTAKVRKVLMKRNFDVGGTKKQRTARYLPEVLSKKNSIYELKIKAIAEQGVFIENDLINAEFRGDLMLLNNFEAPQITAKAELVRGKLLFRNTAFALDHAIVRVPDPDFFNPQFSLGGFTNVSGYKIGIFATGSADNPKISFTSNPGLSQEDILSLLAFGYTGEEAKKVNANERSALTYTEVGSVLLEQLRISKDLESKGVRVTVAPSISESEANIIRPKNSANNAAPKVYVQTKILNNLDASLGSTFGGSQNNELDAGLEYRVGKRASINAIYEQEPGVEANEPRRSYGTDIKFRWGFK